MTKEEAGLVLDAGIKQAIDRAFRDKPDSISVHVDSEDKVYVRGPNDDIKIVGELPKGTRLHCIAQWWNENTVQIRYAGAYSEWAYR